jgi:hypothetical protein
MTTMIAASTTATLYAGHEQSSTRGTVVVENSNYTTYLLAVAEAFT